MFYALPALINAVHKTQKKHREAINAFVILGGTILFIVTVGFFVVKGLDSLNESVLLKQAEREETQAAVAYLNATNPERLMNDYRVKRQGFVTQCIKDANPQLLGANASAGEVVKECSTAGYSLFPDKNWETEAANNLKVLVDPRH